MSAADNVQRTLGYRPRDLAATMWEAVPWSFVADWFGNFGDWIQAKVPDPDMTVRGEWVTTVINETISYGSGQLMVAFPSNPVFNTAGTYPASRITRIRVNRSCSPGNLPSTPTMPMHSLSLSQTLSALSLMSGQIVADLKGIRH